MLLYATGFEWATAEKNIYFKGATFTTSVKRSGSYSVYLTAGSAFYYYINFLFPTALSEFYLQFCFNYSGSNATTAPFFKWCYGSTTLGGLKFNTDRKLELYTGDFATLVGTGSKVLNPNVWYVIEVYIKIADSGGAVEVRVDMNPDISFSGDTKPGTETTVNNIYLGNPIASSMSYYYDDLILHDTTGTANNSWPGGAKVALLKPNADSTTLQWTPTPSGNHYAAVDEVPPSATDYLTAGSADLVDEMDLENLPANAFLVKAVIMQAWAFKNTNTSPTKLALGLDLGGNDYFGSDFNLNIESDWVSEIWNEKPGGGNFSPSDINNAKLLLKSRP